MSETLRTDLLVTWMAAAGAFSLLARILGIRSRRRSLLEQRSVILLTVLGVLCAARGAEWLRPAGWWPRAITMAAAAMLPLALALFVEGLQRRHLPFWMKIAAAGTSVGALLVPLLPSAATVAATSAALAVTLLLVTVALSGVLLRRDRSRLSPAENDVIVVCLAVAAVSVPLVIADVRAGAETGVNRLAGLAVLVLVYALTRVTIGRNRPVRVLWDAGWRLLQGVALAIVVLVFAGFGAVEHGIHAVSAALAFVLLVEIWERLTHQIVVDADRSFLHWLASAKLAPGGSLGASLRQYPLTEQHEIVGADELSGYTPAALAGMFTEARPVCSAVRLQLLRRSASGAELDATEEMLALLATRGMTHACLLRVEPIQLLLVNVPEAADSRGAELELAVIQRYASLPTAVEVRHA